jgi:hypothetical protein
MDECIPQTFHKFLDKFDARVWSQFQEKFHCSRFHSSLVCSLWEMFRQIFYRLVIGKHCTTTKNEKQENCEFEKSMQNLKVLSPEGRWEEPRGQSSSKNLQISRLTVE